MRDHEESNAVTEIELGQASVETKGDAIFQTDGSSGRLVYATGIADD